MTIQFFEDEKISKASEQTGALSASLGGLVVALALLMMPSTGVAQECPSDAPLFCDNCGGYCCPESHPYCTSDCKCAADDGSGGGDGCPSGSYQCGEEYCTDNDRVCCESVGRPDLSCPEGYKCTSDGNCIEGDGSGSGGSTSGGSTGETCTGDQINTHASCGGDQCSCADPCNSNGDCRSGCCARGYCSLPCVCQGEGSLELYCGAGSGYGSSGCSLSGGEGPVPLGAALLALLGIGFLRLRRRDSEASSSKPALAVGLVLGAWTLAFTGCNGEETNDRSERTDGTAAEASSMVRPTHRAPEFSLSEENDRRPATRASSTGAESREVVEGTRPVETPEGTSPRVYKRQNGAGRARRTEAEPSILRVGDRNVSDRPSEPSGQTRLSEPSIVSMAELAKASDGRDSEK